MIGARQFQDEPEASDAPKKKAVFSEKRETWH